MVNLLFADKDGTIYDHPELIMMARSADKLLVLPEDEFIPLPKGCKFFTMPNRIPVGFDNLTKEIVALDNIDISLGIKNPQPVSAFLPPGYVRTYLPGYFLSEDNPQILPLWAYCAVGMKDEEFVVPAFQVDSLDYWDPDRFDDLELVPMVEKKVSSMPNNRLVKHLANCAMEYHCFAAKNYFLCRGEAPVPIAPSCNAACVGCLSLQEEELCLPSHNRIAFVPTPNEIAEIIIDHFNSVPDGIASFGQGCEGDPILYSSVIVTAIKKVRNYTNNGTLNINTNASLPEAVSSLADAGMDSIRISLNSAIEDKYMSYYRPKNYKFSDVISALEIASKKGLFVSINLLVFPGIIDVPEELARLSDIVNKYGVDLIQTRNLNIDPELYLKYVDIPTEEPIGVKRFFHLLTENCPHLKLGYFNQPKISK